MSNVPFTLMYEAFRCLVDDDRAGGQKAAAAITTLSQISQKGVEVNIAKAKKPEDKNDFRVVAQGATYEGTLGLDYDFAFNFMTPAQRDTVRRSLSAFASVGMTSIGCETLRTLHTGTSNWISWGCRALFVVSAIEGEPGYDPSTYKRFANAQANFIASMYPTGEAFEGWGKNFMFLEHMILIAKRDKNLPRLQHARLHLRAQYLQQLFPRLALALGKQLHLLRFAGRQRQQDCPPRGRGSCTTPFSRTTWPVTSFTATRFPATTRTSASRR